MFHLKNFSLHLYNQLAFADALAISRVSVTSRAQYSGTSTPSLVSTPTLDPDDWSSFWNPLYGNCYTFKPRNPLANYVGQAGVEFVQVDLDFTVAFPG